MAGLLISRQIIGNVRESVVPYLLEQWKLAKISFTMWGALSPTQDLNPSIAEAAEKIKNETPQGTPTKQSDSTAESTRKNSESSTSKRNIGQAEIESALYKVGIKY